jgi:GNAT superfamily N-acetyltransferase
MKIHCTATSFGCMIASMNHPGLMLTMQAIRRQVAAMPHDLYRLCLIHAYTHRPFPGERLWTTAQLLSPATVRFLRVRNRDGYDIYIHPDAWDQNAGYILVDLDHADATVVDHMHRNGHQPCLVLQTSPGRLQAWIRICTSGLEPSIATAVARRLAHEYGGDPGSADWRHFGRLAGFTNQKLSRRTERGYAPWVKILHARAGLAENANALVQSARSLWRPVWLLTEASSASRDTLAPITAAEAAAIYHHCLRQWRIIERFRPPNWSIVDLWVAKRLLWEGIAAAQVEAILQLASPQFPRRHGNPRDYLRRTLARATAFPPTGGAVCNDHAPASVVIRSPCSNSTGGR